jgi:hypothetical protein
LLKDNQKKFSASQQFIFEANKKGMPLYANSAHFFAAIPLFSGNKI